MVLDFSAVAYFCQVHNRLKLFEGSFSGGDLKIDLDNQRRCFEIDRKVVVRQLKALQLAITDGATEMEMVAAENVFDTRLSTLLKRRARSLYRLHRA